MHFGHTIKRNRKRHSAWLYSTVFKGRFSGASVLFLLLSFVLQPIHQAYANEAQVPEVEPVVAVVEEVTPQLEVSAPESVADPLPPIVDSQPEIVEEETPQDQAETNNSTESGATEQTDLATTTEAEPDSTEAAHATTTALEPAIGEVVDVQYVVTEENYYQFSKQSCVAVGDGTYHCTQKPADSIDTQSVVYSQQGESGNMEIFLKTARGKTKQITENAFDDTAPHYDAESMRIVWQRLIDGRYQIVLFDIMENEETQLTFSRTNNMEPKVSDAGIVWQAWDNNDWEIMYFDGTYTEQITSNDAQDVTPVVQDGYILWSVLGAQEQEARVYSFDTKETISILGHEGGSIVNPRFVLVYDTEFENGDIVTQSFDPATGLSQPIVATPAPEPIPIPETDPTGEIRALLTSGKNQKNEGELTDVSDDTASSSSTIVPGTLDLTSGEPEIPTPVLSASSSDEFELTEYDLVLPF